MIKTNTPISIVIVDDHLLLAKSLKQLIDSFSGFEVLYHAVNGKELQEKLLKIKAVPDIILLDLNMPVMNGFETASWLTKTHPEIKIVALSMDDDEYKIMKMLMNGAKGYFLKDIHPEELRKALLEVHEKGYFHTEKVSKTLINSLQHEQRSEKIEFKEKELEFMQLACSEMTYKEIADKMNLSPKTIDGYRQELFRKLDVKNRIGLVLFGLKNNIIQL